MYVHYNVLCTFTIRYFCIHVAPSFRTITNKFVYFLGKKLCLRWKVWLEFQRRDFIFPQLPILNLSICLTLLCNILYLKNSSWWCHSSSCHFMLVRNHFRTHLQLFLFSELSGACPEFSQHVPHATYDYMIHPDSPTQCRHILSEQRHSPNANNVSSLTVRWRLLFTASDRLLPSPWSRSLKFMVGFGYNIM